MKKNIINKLKHTLVIISLLFIYTLVCASSYANIVSKDLSESVFRLHVIANSDKPDDQSLKFKVRDNVLSYMNNLCLNTKTKEEAIRIAKNHQDEFNKIAKQTIIDNGYNYDVNIKIGIFDFPTKQYGDISFPAGSYDALRIEIGEAKGQNWWCVMFPPLCFVDMTSGVVPDESKKTLESSLASEEEYILINDNKSNDIQFKFKLVELFQNVKIKTAQN
ncbi:MAG: stage II sporulation protein R [Clostridia bacterium]|nr:stage II sporulation protein R [Clostridia bacterium]